jgi:hypothetical protein
MGSLRPEGENGLFLRPEGRKVTIYSRILPFQEEDRFDRLFKNLFASNKLLLLWTLKNNFFVENAIREDNGQCNIRHFSFFLIDMCNT